MASYAVHLKKISRRGAKAQSKNKWNHKGTKGTKNFGSGCKRPAHSFFFVILAHFVVLFLTLRLRASA